MSEIADAVRTEALRDFTPTGEWAEHQLPLKKGDVVWILQQDESGWWGGYKDGDDMTAWMPADVLRVTEESSESAFGDVSRCSAAASPRRGDNPLFTSDNRRVASPQASGRKVALERELEKKEQDRQLQVWKDKYQKLEDEMKKTRQARDDMERSVDELRLKNSHLMSEHYDERARVEKERQQWKQRDNELTLENYKLKERIQHFEKELAQCQTKIHASSKNEERPVGSSPLSTQCENDRFLMRNGSAGFHQFMPCSVGGERSASANWPNARTEDMASSASCSRRLFSQGDDRRTPSSAFAHPGIASAPTMPTMSGVQSMPVSSSHGRQHMMAQQSVTQSSYCPRPSPRSAQGTSGWTSTLSLSSSPRSQARTVTVAAGHDGTVGSAIPPVRALVSSWERRSNSRGAAPTRAADPSPTSQILYADSPSATSRAACRTASRDQREMPVRIASRSRLPDEYAEPDSYRVETDAAAVVNLGMSPMLRQQAHLHQTPRKQAQALPSASPSAKGTAGIVQDRIRKLNQTFGR